MSSVQTRSAVLLDPYPMWLEAVETALSDIDVEVVGKTTSAEIAVRLVEELRPDLFLLEADDSRGELDGLACLRAARATVPSIRVVVFSAQDDPYRIEAALSAGADAFIVKTATGEEVALAIRQVFDRSIYLGGAAQRGRTPPSESPGHDRMDGSNGDGLGLLTRRESQILTLVAEGHSNADVATMLWLAEQTVKFHLSNIYRKLGVANRTEASRWAQMHNLLAG